MSNENYNRNNIDQKLKESGYVHPETDNCNTDPTYMSYNNDNKGDTYVSGNSSNPYANFSADIEKTDSKGNKITKQILSICPICDTKAYYSCECEYKDLMCKNKHVWFITDTGKLVIGDPHSDDEN